MTAQDLQPPAHGLTKYKLTVADYLTLDRSGAFEGLRTELIEGEIIVMNPQYRPHGFVKDELAYRMRRALEAVGSDFYVMIECSVDMFEHDMPLPDIALTREPRGEGAMPLASIGLIVEVSATTLKFDLEQKGPLYATRGIPEYWVIDIKNAVIHQMWAPDGVRYAETDKVRFGDSIVSKTISGLSVATSGLG